MGMALRKLIVYFVFVISFVFFFMACKDQPNVKDCSRYRNGEFYYKLRNLDSTVNVQVRRTGKVQREIISSTGDMGVFEVQWKDSCTYRMIFLYFKSKDRDSLQRVFDGLQVEATILHGTDEYYVYESTDNKFGRVIRDTAWIVK
jgi:hypothetical protein